MSVSVCLCVCLSIPCSTRCTLHLQTDGRNVLFISHCLYHGAHKQICVLCPRFHFPGWPSRWTSLTLRIFRNQTRKRCASRTLSNWKRSVSKRKAVRSTASWASAGKSYPFPEYPTAHPRASEISRLLLLFSDCTGASCHPNYIM